MVRLSLLKIALIFGLCVATAALSAAQTFTNLVNFEGTNGAGPYVMSLVQGFDGNYYGTTVFGGTGLIDYGTAFKVSPAGELTTLYNFCSQNECSDGAWPFGGLTQAVNGTLYGTASLGGGNEGGTIYSLTADGMTIFYNFCALKNCWDGDDPDNALVQDGNGNLFGMTFAGGNPSSCKSTGGCGTVFEITAAGNLTTLYRFCSQANCSDGANPYGSLVLATDGNFYGTTSARGASNDGTVFKITPAGQSTTLHSFAGSDGASPFSGLVQGSDGNFYGTTSAGGASNDGTVFKITAAGKLTTLHSFAGSDGSGPYADLIQATDGNFYGTTHGGGSSEDGTIFRITPERTLTTLHDFSGGDGALVGSGLLQATNGVLYGATAIGGDLTCSSPDGCGTIFSLSMDFAPFVKTNPTFGVVGSKVVVLGNDLSGATRVTFNGTASDFTVVSATQINTTVPRGATSGAVEVTTPGGTLKSNVIFRVTLGFVEGDSDQQ